MPFDISQVPLTFSNASAKKFQSSGRYFALIVVIIVCVISNIITLIGRQNSNLIKETWGFVFPWVVFGGSALVIYVVSIFSPSTIDLNSSKIGTLIIDKEGVHVVVGKHVRDYWWNDIQSANVRELAKGGNIHAIERMIQIRRKGQVIQGAYDDIIDKSFGIGIDQLKDLIDSGVKEWGSTP